MACGAGELLAGNLAPVADCLAADSVGRLGAASRELRAEAEPHLAALRSKALADTGASPAASRHYAEILGSDAEKAPGVLLRRRRWLLEVDEATRFSQWRTETAVARLMNGVPMDGGDLFAALKRTFLASQVPALAEGKAVAQWMHVLGAVEEQDPVQSRLLASEAWSALAPSVVEDTLIWVVQTAHFVEALPDLVSWLLVAGGPTQQQLLRWLLTLEDRLRTDPMHGRYGPAGDSSQVRVRHVAQIRASTSCRHFAIGHTP